MKIKQQLSYEGKLKHLHERQQKSSCRSLFLKSKTYTNINKNRWFMVDRSTAFQFQRQSFLKRLKEALIIQISFGKMVLGCKGPKELFQQ